MFDLCFTISCSQKFNFITSAIYVVAIFSLLTFQIALLKRRKKSPRHYKPSAQICALVTIPLVSKTCRNKNRGGKNRRANRPNSYPSVIYQHNRMELVKSKRAKNKGGSVLAASLTAGCKQCYSIFKREIEKCLLHLTAVCYLKKLKAIHLC